MTSLPNAVAVRPGLGETPQVAEVRGDAGIRAVNWRRPGRWGALAGVLVLVAAAIASALSLDGDTGGDLLGLGRSIGADVFHLRWQYTAVVVILAGMHYLATAIAARAASGLPLPLGETLLVQLAAAAANRVTPAGLGGSAITARYLSRRGLDLPAAVGAVAALSLFGPITDLGVLAALVFAGRWFGFGGAAHELVALAAKAGRLVAPLRSPWVLSIVAGVAITAAVVVLIRGAHGRASWASFWTPARQLARRPWALATLIIASGTTTLILGFAFVASVAMVPGPRPVAGLGALLVAFMLGAAAGTTVPIPAGLGSTEVALTAVLVSVQVPVATAVQQVLIFRILTFWLPAIFGVLSTRALRRRTAL